jgi:uncharacterized RDD family membrane protein YckC
MTATSAVAAERAGFVTRFLAAFVDGFLIWLCLEGAIHTLNVAAHFLRRFAPPVSLSQVVLVSAPFLTALYFVIAWWWRGQTVGKWLLGVRVVSLGGGQLRLVQSLARFGGYFLSGLPFYLGFLWILGPDRRGFHDRLARTEVVYCRPTGTVRISRSYAT